MANLTVAPEDVAPVRVIEQFTGPAAEPISAGQAVRLDTATGHFTLANATSAAEGRAVGVSLTTATVAGQTITVVKQGLIDLGPTALDEMDYDDPVGLSDDDGLFDDAGGDYTVGRVFPAFGSVEADKILLVEL